MSLTAPARPPILVHCQHVLGVGHLQRTARLVRALREAGEAVLLASGGHAVPGLDLGGAEEIALPPLTSADEAASGVVGPGGAPPDAAYQAARRTRLLEVLAARDPAVIVLELFPFGRHALAFELVPLLLAVADDRARRGARAPRVVVSLRDILVTKANPPWYEAAVLAIVRQWVDRVLVHASPDVVPLSRTFGLADRLADTLVYTGYLGPAPRPREADSTPGEIVVSAGGGRVGGALFAAALAARPRAPAAAARPWRILTGPDLPDETRRSLLAHAAALPPLGGRPAVVVESFHPDLARLLAGAALSVSQAGYNTVLDIVASAVPAVVVPFEASGDEQALRARLFAARGLLTVVEEGAALADRLAAAMEAALAAPARPAAAPIDLGGAARSTAILGRMVDQVLAARRG
jgi:predicted glycosyltransferase